MSERGRLVFVVLRLPHLVLADVGHDERLPAGDAPEIVDDVRGVKMPVVGEVLDVAHRRVALQAVDVREPCRTAARRNMRQPFDNGAAQIGRDRDVDTDILIELGTVDVDVDLASAERVGLEVAGDAVVEPHPERDEQVRLLNRRVHPRLAVHAHHAEIERVRGRHAADAEQRHGNRNVRALGQREHFPFGARQHHAVAGEDERPLGGVDQRQRRRGDRRRRAALRPAPRSGAARPPPSRPRSSPCCASLVMSTSTGPGRPDRAIANASRTAGATSAALVTR